MGLQLDLDRKRFEDLLSQIKYFVIEGTSITPMEKLILKSIKNDVDNIKSEFDSNSEYLNQK